MTPARRQTEPSALFAPAAPPGIVVGLIGAAIQRRRGRRERSLRF